jgi:hypothetical protein
MPVRVGDFGYPYIAVAVNGERYDFAFDTGNMSGLLISPEVAD